MSGSGQCNLTHDGEIRSFLSHYGDNGSFLKPALMNFQNRDLINFFADHEVPCDTEPGGKVFPRSRRASDILDVLIRESSSRGVVIKTGEPVTLIEREETGFRIRTGKSSLLTQTLVIATGGDTYPVTGSTGDGFRFATALGHQISDTGPALTGVYIRDYQFSDLSGISFADLSISLFRDGKKIKTHTGDLLFYPCRSFRSGHS